MKTELFGTTFKKFGFVKLPDFVNHPELLNVKEVVDKFHQSWCADNYDFYTSNAINSSGLTSGQYLTDKQRLLLFKLICNSQLLKVINQIIPQPLFMGSQLFFDPFKPKQANYWHRDPQYHMTVAEQKLALTGPEVLHVRIPLTADPGFEVIPGSHKNWDTEEELQVRLEQNGHKHSENLSNGEQIPLQVGDVLLFSANMIHRGLYGNNRLALDILYCERDPQLTEFIQLKHQPTAEMLSDLNQSLFL
jgi:ectoine hydroxylase-related dioxygenase (phytanoyl-CoA dioxygenase family)